MDYIWWAVAIVVIVVQYFISKQCVTILGAILPTAYTMFIVWFIVNQDVPLTGENIIPFALGLVILISEWINGNEDHKKIKKKMEDDECC